MPDNASPSRERELFEQASEIPSPAERAAFLKGACGNDAALRQRLEALLLAAEAPTGFLPDQPRAVPAFGPICTRTLPDLEKPGDQIGPYKLREKIGAGGCGVVYVAEQETPVRRRVALKVIKLGMDTKSVIARFDAEREALARMDHPNIARVLDAGATATGRPYFVMELVRGIPINAYCDQNNLPTAERLDLFIKVCHAVQHAHQKAIIHRDLKPSNILVTLHDGVPVPKVIDFGIAKATEGRLTDLTVYTELHQFIGTPAYTSPEQAEMSGLDIDTRADIYSLGVLLYELLSGKLPFDPSALIKSGLDEMRRTIREVEPPRPSTRLSTMTSADLSSIAKHRGTDSAKLSTLLRGDLDWIVMKALEKDRTRRYESASTFAQDIQRHLDNETVIARPASAAYRFQKLVRRNKLAFAATTAVVLALIAGISVSAWHAVRATRAERATNEQAAVAKAVNDFLQNDLLLQAVSDQQADRGFKQDPDLTVKEALRRAAEKIGERFANLPLVEAEIRHTLGRAFSGVGDARLGIPHLERAVALRRQLRGHDHADTLVSRNDLALAYHAAGRLADALPIFEETLKLRKSVRAAETRELLTSMGNLALAYRDAGRFTDALALSEETLKLTKAKFGPDHATTFLSMNRLAVTYQAARRLPEALLLYEETLKLQKAKLGHDHPATLTSMHNLAAGYSASARRAEAIALFEETMKLQKTTLGPDHPDTLLSMHHLAVTYRVSGRLTDALPLFEEVLKLKQTKLGLDHPDTLNSMNSLAVAYEKANRITDALPLYEETLKLAKAKLGPDHLDTLQFTKNLAMAHTAAGRRTDDLSPQDNPFSEETVQLRKANLGLDHPATLMSMHHLAVAHRVAGRFAEALPLFEEVLKLKKTRIGPDHPDTFMTMNSLAVAYDAAGRSTDALPLHLETLKLAKAKLGPDHPDTLHFTKNLAFGYHAAGRITEALPLFEETLKHERTNLGPDHSDTLAFLKNLATTYRSVGRLTDAERHAQDALEMQRRRVNDPAPMLAEAAAGLGALQLKLGKFAEAEPLLRECLAIREQHLPDDFRRFNAGSLLGGALLGQKKLAEAEPLLRSGYAGMKAREAKIPAQGRYNLRDALERLVQLAQAKGDPAQAAEWKQALAAFDQPPAPKPPAEQAGAK